MKPGYYFAKLLKKLRGKAIRNSHIDATSKVEAGSEIVDACFDKHSFCGYGCEIINCQIGSFCSIANHVIIGGGMHPMQWVSSSPAFYAGRDSIRAKFSEHQRPAPRRTVIGHDVWIGERALIKQGVNIGTGAVVGMGSVVTRDVEPYAVVAGCPARVIRHRFEPALVRRLLASQWWLLDEGVLRRAAAHATDPEAFLREIGA